MFNFWIFFFTCLGNHKDVFKMSKMFVYIYLCFEWNKTGGSLHLCLCNLKTLDSVRSCLSENDYCTLKSVTLQRFGFQVSSHTLCQLVLYSFEIMREFLRPNLLLLGMHDSLFKTILLHSAPLQASLLNINVNLDSRNYDIYEHYIFRYHFAAFYKLNEIFLYCSFYVEREKEVCAPIVCIKDYMLKKLMQLALTYSKTVVIASFYKCIKKDQCDLLYMSKWEQTLRTAGKKKKKKKKLKIASFLLQ